MGAAPADFLGEVAQNGLALPAVIAFVVLAVISGLIGFGFTRWNKHLDRRAEEKRQGSSVTPPPPPALSEEGEEFLQHLARGRQKRQGPQRWTFTYVSHFAQYQLENTADDAVHDVKIDVVTNDPKPRMITVKTIQLAQLQPWTPLMIPLGAKSRAKDYLFCVRWDDQYGIDQFQRFRVDQAAYE